MPLYRFICSKCGKEETQIVPSDIHFIKCPSCGAKMERQYPKGIMTINKDIYTGWQSAKGGSLKNPVATRPHKIDTWKSKYNFNPSKYGLRPDGSNSD